MEADIIYYDRSGILEFDPNGFREYFIYRCEAIGDGQARVVGETIFMNSKTIKQIGKKPSMPHRVLEVVSDGIRTVIAFLRSIKVKW